MASMNGDDAPEECLFLRVQAENNSTLKGIKNILFKIRKNSTLINLMEAYCERSGLDVGAVKFLFNNHTITDLDTPASLKMENNDTIKVLSKRIVCKLCKQSSCLELQPNDSSNI
ncbi:unnamed protein product [Macrosiphum euphorbiae]|uniref:Ubiquitin-like domain-containing protein n=1 Tax=Macrosiphum euphorbiae TaxID=13131 RepID=A0AAV0Y3S5_9HEMI|nr:unnamed protein product [Macrosiphum euphorbiae]